ncbi:ABC-type spermidine/putrescine transport system, permease component I [Actinopolymorpha cephalotaxi]|uniref:ABC-type spermidine/putrescine transport system permease subunit I n=1 Tax=Actinopolymorpha cephalotaxi TaxID=504797 RepID=A0A1I2L208_9ACTN|nr:ABC transporter permease subunit [Actinopolymorpha cephalotaxi]NYH84713.1 ABC-type spermidine/putrescine transport system permease subunit I [Actinopolymorpha cephalotaxi]SFF71176.1 ABC-type spermidine/putrescine transport system, permease component I [Actinopolymorpha cephalotaxi]
MSNRLRGLLMAAPPVLVVALFVGFPVVAAAMYTLGHTGGPNSVIASIAQRQYPADHWWGTTAAYSEVFASGQFRRSVSASVVVTVVAVVVTVVLAWAIGLYVRLSGSRLAKVFSALAVVPLFIPVVIASYAILTFYAQDGFLRTVAHLVGWESAPTLSYTMVAVTIGQIWVSLPFGVLMMTSGLNAVPTVLVDAARDAGATLPRAVWSVMLPMNVVPTVIVATFTGISVLGSFTVPYLTGPSAPNMLGPQMTNTFGSFNQPQQAQVMAMVVFALAAVIGAVYVWANFRTAKRSGAVL